MFTDYFFPELGGIQDSVAITGRALGRRGHRVDIHAPRYGKGDFRRIGATMGEPDRGANVRVRRRRSLPFPSSTRQSRVALISPLAWIRLGLQSRPDIIHVHSFFGAGLEALLSAACLGIPVVGTNHTTVAGFAPHLPVSADLAASYVRWFYNRCDRITAPSRSVFDELGTNALIPPCQVISNPIDTGLFSPLPEGKGSALKARFGLSGPVITFAGRLGPEKHVDVLLRALALLGSCDDRPDHLPELAIAGHGSQEASLRALAAQLGIGSRVHFLGTLTHTELADLLRASEVFAIMSTSETQSMVLLQAMACGIPVIAARARALGEFVTQATGLLVAPHDHAGLASSLNALLASPQRRQALGAGGRRTAERFGIDQVTDQWEALYRAMLDRETHT